MKKFSVSEANDFKACPRLYFYKHVCGWEQTNKPSWLTKGSAYDKLLEHWDIEGFDVALKNIPVLFLNAFEAIDAEYILRLYNEKFKDAPLPPIAFDNKQGNQLGFGVDFKGNEVTGPVEFRVTGYLDKLTSFEGGLEVVERKTTSEPIEPNSSFWGKWSMDPQTKNYVWYLRSMGARAGWVTVEVIRKISTTVNPKAFDKKCSVEEYRARLETHVEKKTLVARHRFYVSEDQSDEFIVDHTNVLKDINFCKEKQERIESSGFEGEYAWTKNQGSCNNYGGCPHLGVCEGVCKHGSSGKFLKSEKWLKQQKGARM